MNCDAVIGAVADSCLVVVEVGSLASAAIVVKTRLASNTCWYNFDIDEFRVRRRRVLEIGNFQKTVSDRKKRNTKDADARSSGN